MGMGFNLGPPPAELVATVREGAITVLQLMVPRGAEPR